MSAAVQARSPLPTVHHVRLGDAGVGRLGWHVFGVWRRLEPNAEDSLSRAMSGSPARADSVISAARVRSRAPTVRRASRVQ